MEHAAHNHNLNAFLSAVSRRGSNAADPESVIKARKMEAELIAAWVKMERVRFRQSH